MNKNLVTLMKFIGESVDDIDFDKELGDYYGTGDTLDRFRAIFNQLNLGEYTDENIQKAIDNGNFSDNEKNFIWDTFATDDDYDEDYDTEELFESSIKKLCNVAGKPALAEAVMKLYKVYHPVMEASDVVTELFSDYCDKEGITRLDPENISTIINKMIVDHRITYEEGEELYNEFKTQVAKHGLLESAHKVPEEMARAVNDYVADTFYTNPDTREQLRASELESNWEWLDDDASELIPVWDETHSGEAVWNAKCDIDERGVGAAEASMM